MGRLFILIVALMLPQHGAAQDRAALTDELDRFAAAHLDRIQPRSIADGAEYCGLLGFDANGKLAASPATRGNADSCTPGDAPAGLEVLASWHTHGAYNRDADTEVPSLDDLQSDIEEGIDGYIATPGGRLWLNDADAQQSVLLCGAGCIRADPQYRPCPAFPPGEIYTLDTLRARAENDTGGC
ncbi:MAG: DUF4329 domain-containing protein [Proteobacteria bacterium]|nr:DUF4329 domain-containing protein [Pseudomonadota bacterium]